MPSPFPGMDPYLESHWRDVHARLIVYMADAIQDHLPASLQTRIEERVVTEMPDEKAAGFYPDFRVVEYRSGSPAAPLPDAGVAEPTLVEVIPDASLEPITETFIEIIDASSGNKVVTVVEVLSPTNKTPGESMLGYKRKQSELCRSSTNLVEIDLLRGGKHTLAFPLLELPETQRTRYKACIRRATSPNRAEVYSFPLDLPLPAIRVPLRPADADVILPLQPLLQQCYRRGYEGRIDYNRDPQPPFTEAEAEWADTLLREAGVRSAPSRKR